ncbi:MAG: leucyl aminopeptidase [Pseudonocardiales bacterium]|nr:MAG: leucyl aminopeptidase [Pseudonocardiales bacterium]
MPTLALTDTVAGKSRAAALVIGIAKGEDGPVLATGAESLDEAMGGKLLPALIAVGATGKEGEVTKLATLGTAGVPVVVAAGLGKADEDGRFRTESVRRAAGAATRALSGTPTVASTLGLVNGDDEATVRAAGEGALLGAYDFTRYRALSQNGRKAPVAKVTLVVGKSRDRLTRAAVARSTALAAAADLARDLVNTPPNDLHPVELAAAARDAAKAAGVRYAVLDEKALAKGGFGGILAVGNGSANPPRLVLLSYRGAKAKTSIGLVGKGITFDTGGISIKPSTGMNLMKSDMAGAAAVVAAVCAAADLGLALDIDAWVPMAENMPGGNAYRPGDVVTMYGGRTVEVLNTDAEGRMILADALVRAAEDKPAYLVETSTLTAAQVVALGHRVSAVMGDEALSRRVEAAGERSGEPMWAMPLPEEVRSGIDSPIADISQINAMWDRGAGMLVAGTFLAEFVPDGLPFAHIDIAGPSYNSFAPYGYTPQGGTGVPVRTLVELMEDLAANG